MTKEEVTEIERAGIATDQAGIEIDIETTAGMKDLTQGLTDGLEAEVAREPVDHHDLEDLDHVTGVGIGIGIRKGGVGMKGKQIGGNPPWLR